MLSTKFVLAGLTALAVSASPAGRHHHHPAPTTKITDTVVLQYAAVLENLEAAFYSEALSLFSDQDFADSGFEDWVRPQIAEIGAEEAEHVAFLRGALGKAYPKPCTYDFGFTTPTDFVTKAFVIEGVGVSAYAGAAPLIKNKQILEYAAQILPIEARHTALISRALALDGSPSAFDTPLDLSEVYTLASPFIVKCPRSNPSLPVTVFPGLTAALDDRTVTFSFKPAKRCAKKLYAIFLEGINVVSVPLRDNMATIPEGLGGRVYMVISDKPQLADGNIIAGPTFVTLPSIYA